MQKKQIFLGNNYFNNFFDLITEFKCFSNNFIIITDENIVKTLPKYIQNCNKITILSKNVKAKLDVAIELSNTIKNYDFIIAIGSGTINDLVKYASFVAKKPYVIFATALSMNGYLSANSSLFNQENLKQSFLAKQAEYAVFDLEFLQKAPLRLTKSGLGDSICNNSIRADMILSHYLFGTKFSEKYFCNNNEKELFSHSDKLQNKEIIRILAKILIKSGLNMLEAGGSYPASQGEHLIAHLYEILDYKNSQKSFHGEQIAVTSYFMSELQESFLSKNTIKLSHKKPDISILPKKIQNLAKKEFLKKKINDIEEKNSFLGKNYQSIKEHILKNFLPSKEIKNILDKANISTNYAEINWQKENYYKACQNAFLIRDRWTFLDLQFYVN